jgi:putative inorganic carbon (hco3(-)) transporter
MTKRSRLFFFYLAGLAFATPLIFVPFTNELYEFPKMFFVYFFGGLVIALWLFLKVLRGETFPQVPLYIKLFLASFVISSLFSSHLYTSVWGYYTRFCDCLMSTLTFFGLYLVAKSEFNRSNFDKLFKIVLFTLIPVGAYAVSQSGAVDRVYSTFGQPNWLAQYVVLLLPLVIYLYLTEPFWILWFCIASVSFAGMWFSYSLSGILGLAVALGLFCFIFRRTLLCKKHAKLKLAALGVVFFILAITNLGVYKLRVLDVIKDAKTVISDGGVAITVQAQTAGQAAPEPSAGRNLSDPGFIRAGLWSATLKLITSSPKVFFIGTGPETFPYAFQKFRPPILNYSSEWNFVFNKPHNYFLELWSEQGLIGLVSLIYLIWVLTKKLDRKYLPGFVGFMVTNIFGWPTVATFLLLWLFLASVEAEE